MNVLFLQKVLGEASCAKYLCHKLFENCTFPYMNTEFENHWCSIHKQYDFILWMNTLLLQKVLRQVSCAKYPCCGLCQNCTNLDMDNEFEKQYYFWEWIYHYCKKCKVMYLLQNITGIVFAVLGNILILVLDLRNINWLLTRKVIIFCEWIHYLRK